ncbi:Glucuronosyltransferase [Aphelenchoides fujianensis]|nr:Glucuronosyltransferase [Aphelenchoides fujianensis]
MERVEVNVDSPAFQHTSVELCGALLSQKEVLDELREQKYDVGITAMFDACGIAVFHLLGIRSTVGMSPTAEGYGIRPLLGLPSPPSYVPDIENQDLQGDSFTWRERLQNFFHHLAASSGPAHPPPAAPLRSTGPELPADLRTMTADKKKPLPADVERALSAGEKGRVLFSFGTYAKTSLITPQTKAEILRAFRKFPKHSFLWKVDDLEQDAHLFDGIPNVFRFKWTPADRLAFGRSDQSFHFSHGPKQLLRDLGCPSRRAAHCHSSVRRPVQQRGVCRAERAGSEALRKAISAEESVTAALNEVLNNPKYAENARRLAAIIAKYPEDPKETLIRYVELSAEFPQIGQLLRLGGDRLHWLVHYSFDVVALLFLALVGVVISGVLVFRLPSYLLHKAHEQKRRQKAE